MEKMAYVPQSGIYFWIDRMGGLTCHSNCERLIVVNEGCREVITRDGKKIREPFANCSANTAETATIVQNLLVVYPGHSLTHRYLFVFTRRLF
jgi:hypothetical protein